MPEFYNDTEIAIWLIFTKFKIVLSIASNKKPYVYRNNLQLSNQN